MISLIEGLFRWLFQKEQMKMLLLGLDNAGKTTTLEYMKKTRTGHGLSADQITPTIGLNVATVDVDIGTSFAGPFGASPCGAGHTVQVTVWDLGGQVMLRSIWRRYFQECEVGCWISIEVKRASLSWPSDQPSALD
eukprot:Selendium_serpulae@DN8655_c0_g1_i1.p2